LASRLPIRVNNFWGSSPLHQHLSTPATLLRKLLYKVPNPNGLGFPLTCSTRPLLPINDSYLGQVNMTDTLHNAPIVLDNGSGTIRAGFAGEDLPKCYFPSFVGRPKHLRVLAGALEGDVFIGQRAQELRGLLKIRYPLEHGIVSDWDDMERIWEWVYTEGLKTLSEEVRPNPGAMLDLALTLVLASSTTHRTTS